MKYNKYRKERGVRRRTGAGKGLMVYDGSAGDDNCGQAY